MLGEFFSSADTNRWRGMKASPSIDFSQQRGRVQEKSARLLLELDAEARHRDVRLKCNTVLNQRNLEE